MLREASGLAIALTLCACQAPQPATQSTSSPTAQLQQARAACAARLAAPGLESIRDRIVIDEQPRQPTFQMMTDSATPDATERAELDEFRQRRADCIRDSDLAESPAAPWREARIANTTALARLYSGHITFGEYNRLYADNVARAEAAIARDATESQRARAIIQEQRRTRRAQTQPRNCQIVGTPPNQTLLCF